ncbi:MAG: 8-amino-7-oxononanoate synthase [Acidobacteria bacterium]|nr:MAG: 8-amino-7-oxononanoate synthase [Acidobacteriota bacterium]
MVKAQVRELTRRMDAELAALAWRNQLRTLGTIHGVNLSSNDYLGLATDPRLLEAVTSALVAGSAVGSTGSRLLSGNAEIWEELESEVAQFMGSEAALYFNSGYSANVGLLSAVIRPSDVVFSDAANHASIIDGLRLAGAPKVIFPHLDMDSLERQLGKDFSGAAQKFIVSESIFSMDGDRASIVDLVALAERYGAELIIDEAHATGAVGPQGRGLVAASRLSDRVLVTVHPCGKALAGMGCFVCCSEELKQYLVNRARPFIFSTALPSYIAAQMRAAVRIVAAADRERSDLAGLSAFLRERLREAGFDIGKGDTQIVPVFLGENERAIRFSALLNEAGFGVRPIRPPSVPAGTSRLRLSLTAKLSTNLLAQFADALISIRAQEQVPLNAVRS